MPNRVFTAQEGHSAPMCRYQRQVRLPPAGTPYEEIRRLFPRRTLSRQRKRVGERSGAASQVLRRRTGHGCRIARFRSSGCQRISLDIRFDAHQPALQVHDHPCIANGAPDGLGHAACTTAARHLFNLKLVHEVTSFGCRHPHCGPSRLDIDESQNVSCPGPHTKGGEGEGQYAALARFH